MTLPYDAYREAEKSFPTIIFTGSNSDAVTTFLTNVGARAVAAFTVDATSGVGSLTVNGTSHPVNEGDAVVATVDPSTQLWVSRELCADPTATPVIVVSADVFQKAFVGYIIAPPPQPTPTS